MIIKLRDLRTAKCMKIEKVESNKSELHYLQDSQFKIERIFEPKIVTAFKIDAVLPFTR